MIDPMMSSDRFRALAEAFGGAIDRWPAHEQAAARERLAAEPALAQALGEAAALDALLDTSSAPAFSGVLRERLMAEHRKSTRVASPVVRWLSGAGLAAACLVGVVTGAHYSDSLIGTPQTATNATESVATTHTAFDSSYSEVLGVGETG
ncbi:MAG TPA: hypothetical protein VFN88_03380 [Caulobacteraceae bacterium]|nr:hypothetical protein [Caulobacteraceae bacterium]